MTTRSMYDRSEFFCDDSDASELGPGLLTPLSPVIQSINSLAYQLAYQSAMASI